MRLGDNNESLPPKGQKSRTKRKGGRKKSVQIGASPSMQREEIYLRFSDNRQWHWNIGTLCATWTIGKGLCNAFLIDLLLFTSKQWRVWWKIMGKGGGGGKTSKILQKNFTKGKNIFEIFFAPWKAYQHWNCIVCANLSRAYRNPTRRKLLEEERRRRRTRECQLVTWCMMKAVGNGEGE